MAMETTISNFVVATDEVKTRQAKSIADLQLRFQLLEDSVVERPKYARVRIDSKEFAVVKTGIGPLLVSTDSVQPYLDGFRVVLNVGNPWSLSYLQLKISANWQDPFPLNRTNSTALAFKAWEDSKKVKESTAVKDFLGGTWTQVEIIVAPCTATQLRECTVSFESSAIQLLEARK